MASSEGSSLVIDGREIELLSSEVQLMLFLSESGDITASHTAERLGIPNSTVNQTLSRLERKGILNAARDAAADRRELGISFTELGSKVVEHFRKLRMEAHAGFEEYLESLSESERKVISMFLSRMHDSVGRFH
jgi:DNA-binding MarR family transcriptional regulator